MASSEMFNAVVEVYPAYIHKRPAIRSAAMRIANELERLGARPEQVAERWEWVEANVPKTGTTGIKRLVTHWAAAGDAIASEHPERADLATFVTRRLSAGRVTADLDQRAECIADRLLALGCRDCDEARQRAKWLEAYDEDAGIADLPDRWAEVVEAMATAPAEAVA